jgi:hypothetical protein
MLLTGLKRTRKPRLTLTITLTKEPKPDDHKPIRTAFTAASVTDGSDVGGIAALTSGADSPCPDIARPKPGDVADNSETPIQTIPVEYDPKKQTSCWDGIHVPRACPAGITI